VSGDVDIPPVAEQLKGLLAENERLRAERDDARGRVAELEAAIGEAFDVSAEYFGLAVPLKGLERQFNEVEGRFAIAMRKLLALASSDTEDER
jgi:hypothetical protein